MAGPLLVRPVNACAFGGAVYATTSSRGSAASSHLGALPGHVEEGDPLLGGAVARSGGPRQATRDARARRSCRRATRGGRGAASAVTTVLRWARMTVVARAANDAPTKPSRRARVPCAL